MQLIYKTDSGKRADEIHGHLRRAGIPAEIHGDGTYTLTRSRAADTLSVWVLRNEDIPRAKEVLEVLFRTEAMATGISYPPRVVNTRTKFSFLIISAFIVCIFSLIAAYGM